MQRLLGATDLSRRLVRICALSIDAYAAIAARQRPSGVRGLCGRTPLGGEKLGRSPTAQHHAVGVISLSAVLGDPIPFT
jgi:hypothetical protein